MLGKNIIITDNIDWSTREIVETSIDRWQGENRFRASNDERLVIWLIKPPVWQAAGCLRQYHLLMFFTFSRSAGFS